MIYRRRPKFKKSFAKLPRDVQEKAAKAFELFKENPRHPSLNIKKMEGYDDIWEGRLDDFWRFTFEYVTEEGETICYFRNIGRHDILDHSP